MRRLAHILLSLALSVVIVALSAGITTVRCNHGGEKACCATKKACCGDEAMPCMTVTVHRLSPTDVAPAYHFTFTNHAQPLAPFLTPLWLMEAPCLSVTAPTLVPEEPDTGSPRRYLRRLRVLQI